MDLKGTTDLLSLFDVTQMLSINEATGMLKVECAEGRGYLYFQAGNIINAMDGIHPEGEEAARSVFAMKHASYTFTTDLPSVAHRISVPTQNLMMEVARVLDEEAETKGGEVSGLESRVQETQEATRHLREIFTKLDSEARILSLRSPDGFGLVELLDAIRDSADSTLYIREGAAPEVHAADRVIPLAQRMVSREGYEGLRQILFRESEPLSALSEARTERVLSFGERGRYLLDAWKSSNSEVLTIRRLPEPASLAEALPWNPATVDSLLREPGSLVLLTGPDGARLGRVFEATCAHLSKACPGPFLGFARRWTPGWGNDRATVVRLSTAYKDDLASAGPLIERLGPALVAVEDSDHLEARAIAFHALQRGTRVMMGVAAAAVSHAPFRILDGVDAARRDTLVRHLGLSLTGVLSVPRTANEPAKTWMVEEAARTALMHGDLGVLTRELAALSRSAAPLR
jgi:hypothetical protein